MDLSRAYEEAKSLPDSVLQREVSAPTGGVPGYIALAELAERRAIRAGGSGQNVQTLAQKYGLVQGYSAGGVINSLNPLGAMVNAIADPNVLATLQQEGINEASGGLPRLRVPQPASPLPQASSLTDMTLQRLRNLSPVTHTGGVAGLLNHGN